MAYQNYAVEEHRDLRAMLDAVALKYGERTAFLEKQGGVVCSYNYARLRQDVDALGTALQKRKLAGKRVMLFGENCYAWIVSFFAVTCGGGAAVTVDRGADEEAVRQIAERTKAAAVICSDEGLSRTEGLPDGVQVLLFSTVPGLIEEGAKALKKGNFAYRNAKIDPDAMSVLLFVSGAQKGVMLSQHNLCFDTAEICRMIAFTPDDVFLSILPIHHAYEMTCGILCPLSCGASVAFSEGLRSMTREMKEYHPTVLNCVPYLMETMYNKVQQSIRRQNLERQIQTLIRMTNAIRPGKARVAAKRRTFSMVHKSFGGRLRLIISGGAAADPEVLRGFRDFGILALQSYSLVECAPIAAINRDRYFDDTAAGVSMPDALVDIYDMQDDGIGEIRCKGENVMLGYFEDPDLTARVLHDGWFYTGDLGYLDSDGFLHIIGRKKNLILSASGKKIFPEELEALLCSSKFVLEAAVVGVFDEKRKDYDLVAILRPDTQAIRALGDIDVRQRTNIEMRRAVADVNAMLPPFKQIKSFRTRSEPFARNAAGQLTRKDL